MYRIGTIQKKILISLMGGVALGLSRNPRQYFNTLKKINKAFENAQNSNLKRAASVLARKKLVE